MTESEIREIVVGFFEDAINNQDVEALERFCAPSYVWHGGDQDTEDLEEVSGLPAFKELVARFFVAFPDFHTDIRDVVVGPDRAAVRYVEGGTFAADFIGVRATNEKVTWPGLGIYRVEDGKIAEEWFQSGLVERLRAAGGDA